ncbi:MAG: N-6 DNA methylase [Saprospiraceae bacterium]|uniref:site-specific DNA-methyltransferase (adenine-specific) n=1 Tax=Candidatus Defluviibacterium haderslevense TaxID=2981993 RepID=A0A9D7SCK7_9BACT|nr:N-6 DNA methylase [Candidatus Defluviibacterium haderslevense]
MLDNITKKNIDDCRDVLVGKVPDPKSQIEQITLALIYKFMDDMDKEAVEKFKGKAKFFTGEYAKYGWRKLFDPSLSGQEMLALYSEALEKLNTNPNIPELFRNIFKNAYLPYRDPSTLKLFLKYINEFEYSHSEKLGDAFEYLLSVMGSQGDAGQFRTPRHIIDFVTACVNPQKNEIVLDPACGTAGFLLSAYKHILNYELKVMNDKFPNTHNSSFKTHNPLSPDERRKLGQNIVGYDISPDMVRLSLANMYLHGFSTPNIHEYDTLSSEDRWQETFDVILANPPFMTPKGGIRPHKKFGVQANKAEVLFTDYIAEHLNSNGRAGIVVPNGIVATSQTAYKQLRKMLVQDSLIAVISLPAGVFQPYSGVKTSVLILDKRLAKKSKHILFLKIDNDGFDLGAQRREIDKNDLPLALQTLESYKESLSIDMVFEDFPSLATLVEKEIVLGNKDVVLSAERYFVNNKIQNTEYDLVKLENVFKLTSGKFLPKKNFVEGDYLVYGGNGVTGNHNEFFVENETIVIGRVGEYCGAVHLTKSKCWVTDNCLMVTQYLMDIDQRYLLRILNEANLNQYAKVGGQPSLSQSSIYEIEILLPPLEIQQQIVAEIESYQKIIDGAKQVVNNYKPSITINPDWEMLELGTLAKLVGGSTPSKENSSYWENGNVDWITCSDFSNSPMYIEDSIRKITEKAIKENSTSIVPKDTLVLVTRVSLGKMAFVRKPTALNQDLTALLFDEEKINKRYGYFFLLSIADKIKNDGHGATVKGVTRDYVKDIKVPLPSLEEQQTIVKAIEEELQLVNANKRLIEIFELKIKTKIGEVWGVKEEVGTV